MRSLSCIMFIALTACGDGATEKLPILEAEQFASRHQDNLSRLSVDIGENEINLVRHIRFFISSPSSRENVWLETTAWVGGPATDQLSLKGQYGDCPVFEREFDDDDGRLESALDHVFDVGGRSERGCANRETRTYGFADKNRFGERIWNCPLQVISLRLSWSDSLFNEAINSSKALCINIETDKSE